MTEKDQQEQKRVSKREFLAQVSNRSHIPAKTVNRVYDTILAELMDIVTRGDQLMLTGFGKFYPQAHKGHRVQFADSGTEAIDDYYVLKFSATRSVNKSLVQKPSDSDEEVEEDSREGELLETDAEQDALFEAKPAAKSKAKAAPKTTAPRARKTTTTTPSASLAAAAMQSSRAINRAKRQAVGQIVKGSTSDRAI